MSGTARLRDVTAGGDADDEHNDEQVSGVCDRKVLMTFRQHIMTL